MQSLNPRLLVCALCLMGLAVGPSARADALSPQLQYDPDTGELQILNPDPPVAQVVIQGGPFQPGQFVQPPETSILNNSSTSLSILFLNPQPAGPVSFGPYLPAGLDEQQFQARISSATSQGSPMTLVYVPEPASLSLLTLGGLAVLRRRRGAA